MTTIVVCVTGASGSRYAQRTLQLLAAVRDAGAPLTVHWVASSNAPIVWQQELDEAMPAQLPGARRWDRHDFSAPFASGSSAPDAVLVVPCSMSTLARVAHGGGDDLVTRTCEVALKERTRLILVVRETPLSLVHLRNMVAATEAGAVVLPAVPSFYGSVRTLEQAIDTVVVRALDRAGVRVPDGLIERWGAPVRPARDPLTQASP
ncbi:MAG: UbiX family flavin prenyltransferase [Myxococcales bacterium]|nr:UbiX family flavin prenyltransferase [Myxococcales bacterium]